jgi:riboflavin synthase
MFTGIITDVGHVVAIAEFGDRRIRIATAFATDTIEIGASIACSGVCLTVVEKGDDWFALDVSAETLAKSVLRSWQPGTRVNLERALRLGDEMGGHILTGHVDGIARLIDRREEGGSLRLNLEIAMPLARFIAPKGAIALDGVSLTVNEVSDNRFGVNIIPHTRQMTTLDALAAGDRVNVETDILARYVARLREMEGA